MYVCMYLAAAQRALNSRFPAVGFGVDRTRTAVRAVGVVAPIGPSDSEEPTTVQPKATLLVPETTTTVRVPRGGSYRMLGGGIRTRWYGSGGIPFFILRSACSHIPMIATKPTSRIPKSTPYLMVLASCKAVSDDLYPTVRHSGWRELEA